MKKIAFLTVIALLLSLTVLPVRAGESTEYITVNTGVKLSVNAYSSGTSALRTYTIEGGRNSTLKPIVVFGDGIYGKLSVYDVLAEAEDMGYTPMAVINSDFFSMESGVPTGMNVVEGRLCSSGSDWNCVGFNRDGTAFCGAPELKISIEIGGKTYPLAGINKMRTASGIYLFTSDFGDSVKTIYEGHEIVLSSFDDEQLRINHPLELSVLSSAKAMDTAIPEGQFVLSVTSTSSYYGLLSSLRAGQTVTVKAECKDKRWANAEYVSGGGNMLAINGEPVEANLKSTSADPRTVIGVRDDGSYVIMVADGRLKGVSDGMTLRQAAEAMLEQGCLNVINLDGGGSSMFLVRRPGELELELISNPSEGRPRDCSVYIVLVNKYKRVGTLYGSAVYPENDYVLAGAKVSLKTTYYDQNFYPIAPYTVSGGSITQSAVFTAPDRAQRVTITPNLSVFNMDDAVINVVDRPDSITVYSGGKALEEITCETGSGVDLDVVAVAGGKKLLSEDKQFTYALTGSLGTVDENGVFTATAPLGSSGSLTVSFGKTSVTLPVKIQKEQAAGEVKYSSYSFADISNHWAANYIEFLYREGIFSKDKNFNPQGTLTNAMTVTLISRYLKLDTSLYADIGLPYSDAAGIPDWALPHVKAAYAQGLLSAAFGGDKFEPNASSTRAQVMTVLSMSTGDSSAYPHAPFSDYNEAPAWAAAHIDRLYALGIVNGYAGTDQVRPLASITRAEMAALMIRLY